MSRGSKLSHSRQNYLLIYYGVRTRSLEDVSYISLLVISWLCQSISPFSVDHRSHHAAYGVKINTNTGGGNKSYRSSLNSIYLQIRLAGTNMFKAIFLLPPTFFVTDILQIIHSTCTQSKLAIESNIVPNVTYLKQKKKYLDKIPTTYQIFLPN